MRSFVGLLSGRLGWLEPSVFAPLRSFLCAFSVYLETLAGWASTGDPPFVCEVFSSDLSSFPLSLYLDSVLCSEIVLRGRGVTGPGKGVLV